GHSVAPGVIAGLEDQPITGQAVASPFTPEQPTPAGAEPAGEEAENRTQAVTAAHGPASTTTDPQA
ncbi:MAG: hypothetical protein L0L41_06745, partial [Acetobacter sp.]|nr:hypothetical protein [Acetobacter sp.]